MLLSDLQVAVLQKILSNFQDHLRLYGDDESEELMQWLSSSFNANREQDKKPVRFVMSFNNRLAANVANDYFRSDRFLKVDKNEVLVEMVTTNKLTYASSDRLKGIFLDAGISEEYGQDDIDDSIIAARSLLWSGGSLVSITPDEQ